MEKKIAGLLGAVAALSTMTAAQAAAGPHNGSAAGQFLLRPFGADPERGGLS